MNSKQLAQDRKLRCGHMYEYHKKMYLIVMTNNDKSRGLEVTEITQDGVPKLGEDAYFFNENAEVCKKPVTKPIQAADLTDGQYIVSDGVLYEFYYYDKEDGVTLKDYPSGACPILFQIPAENEVELLIGWADSSLQELEAERLAVAAVI